MRGQQVMPGWFGCFGVQGPQKHRTSWEEYDGIENRSHAAINRMAFVIKIMRADPRIIAV